VRLNDSTDLNAMQVCDSMIKPGEGRSLSIKSSSFVCSRRKSDFDFLDFVWPGASFAQVVAMVLDTRLYTGV
jgi:hypothetical protein